MCICISIFARSSPRWAGCYSSYLGLPVPKSQLSPLPAFLPRRHVSTHAILCKFLNIFVLELLSCGPLGKHPVPHCDKASNWAVAFFAFSWGQVTMFVLRKSKQTCCREILGSLFLPFLLYWCLECDCDGWDSSSLFGSNAEGYTFVITEEPESLVTVEPSFQSRPGYLYTFCSDVCEKQALTIPSNFG